VGRGVGVEGAGRVAIPGAGVVSRLRWCASDGRAGRANGMGARTALETALTERARRGAGTLKGSDTFAAAAALWLERGWSGWRGWGSGRREQWRHTHGS
jgi:hypothetical protein